MVFGGIGLDVCRIVTVLEAMVLKLGSSRCSRNILLSSDVVKVRFARLRRCSYSLIALEYLYMSI